MIKLSNLIEIKNLPANMRKLPLSMVKQNLIDRLITHDPEAEEDDIDIAKTVNKISTEAELIEFIITWNGADEGVRLLIESQIQF